MIKHDLVIGTNFRGDKFSRGFIFANWPKFAKIKPREIFKKWQFAKISSREILFPRELIPAKIKTLKVLFYKNPEYPVGGLQFINFSLFQAILLSDIFENIEVLKKKEIQHILRVKSLFAV